MTDIQQKIEALLFYKNQPVSFSWLAKTLTTKPDLIKNELQEMKTFYDNRGISLIMTESNVSLMTSQSSQEIIQSITKNEEARELSKQALETLAIIAYSGTITKSEIDYIRGVNSVFILRNLRMRGLIEKKDNDEDKRSPLYHTSSQALSYIGIQEAAELPNKESFDATLTQLRDEFSQEDIPESETDE